MATANHGEAEPGEGTVGVTEGGQRRVVVVEQVVKSPHIGGIQTDAEVGLEGGIGKQHEEESQDRREPTGDAGRECQTGREVDFTFHNAKVRKKIHSVEKDCVLRYNSLIYIIIQNLNKKWSD